MHTHFQKNYLCKTLKSREISITFEKRFDQPKEALQSVMCAGKLVSGGNVLGITLGICLWEELSQRTWEDEQKYPGTNPHR